MKLDKEDYKRAVGILKRYNYNCLRTYEIRDDIISISASNNTGLPKAPYTISDSVFNTYKKLSEDKELLNIINEQKAVDRALKLVDKHCNYIFEELYQKDTYKWDIIEKMGISEETFKRRKRELIYAVDKEYKKLI